MSDADNKATINRLRAILEQATGAPTDSDALKRMRAVLDAAGAGAPAPGEFAPREVTILLADLRGFAAMAEQHPPEMLVGLLNALLGRLIEAVYHHGGTIDKFMGDSIMVLFGAQARHEDDAQRAVTCAVEMQNIVDAVNRESRSTGLPSLYLGIGVNTGTVLAGMLGSSQYSEYAVLGSEVNLAARIEAFSLRGQVLVSESTYRHCRGIVCGDPMEVYVKGRAQPARVREVLGVPGLGLKVPRQDVRRSHRVKVNIPFTYQIVRNKIVMPERMRGTILNIGYYGVLAEFEQELERYSEIRLAVTLAPVGLTAADIYARTVTAKLVPDRCLMGVEFTSVSEETDEQIRHLVQLLIQGGETQ